jgi:hypothetical protein
METSAQRQYEFTTPRIVLIIVGIVLWLLCGVMAASAGAEEGGSYAFGAMLGAMGIGLLISWIVRCVYRLIRRRPVIYPAWTPGLFFGAAFVALLSAAGQLSNSA